MRIMTAVNDADRLMFLATCLPQWGYDPLIVTHGEEAYGILTNANAPRIAMIDWSMPDISGLEICHRIRSQADEHFPYLILLTSPCQDDAMSEDILRETDDLLSIPLTMREVRIRLDIGRRVVEMQDRLAGYSRQLDEYGEHIKILRNLLPVCSCCRRIRNDIAYWDSVQAHLDRYAADNYAYGICPECIPPIQMA